MKDILNPMNDKSFSRNLKLPFNYNRLEYLLQYFNVDIQFVLNKLNKVGTKNERKNKITQEDLQQDSLPLSLIKQIDAIFEKGLSFYSQKENIEPSKTSSIFFRKQFNNSLNFEDRKVVSKFEEKRLNCELLAQNIDFQLKREFKIYNYKTDNPQIIAQEIKEQFKQFEANNLESNFFQKELKNTLKQEYKFLKTLFTILEAHNIFIFEHKEYYQERFSKDKLTIDGFYITPYIIVVKQQQSVRKEIFTLLHEFAHYLINYEEVEKVDEEKLSNNTENEIEKWCNQFAFHFLISAHISEYTSLPQVTSENNYLESEIENFYKKTFLSYSSLYTGLKQYNLISQNILDKTLHYLNEKFKEYREEEKRKLELKKLQAQEENKTLPFIPAKKEYNSQLFQKLLEINVSENIISQGYYNIKGRIKDE